MPNHNHFLPIVGSKHHAKALALLSILPIGAKLTLVRDPHGQSMNNPHSDPTAIAVVIRTTELGTLPAHVAQRELGMGAQQIFARDEWMLGYIPAALAKVLSERDPLPQVTLNFTATGKPQCREIASDE